MTCKPGRHRFFLEELPDPASGAGVSLSPAEAHHALHVLRVRIGAEVELFDGRGRSAAGLIAQAGRGQVTVEIHEPVASAGRAATAVHLAFAVPKGKRLDWLLEKVTELGAASIQPIVFHRSVADPRASDGGGESLSGAKRRRWLSHCVSAAKQCGLNFLPEILPPVSLGGFLRAGRDGVRRKLVGVIAGPPLAEAMGRCGTAGGVCILVGPEGGLTDGELSEAVDAGFTPVRLGRTTLRTETAAVALLAAVVAMSERATTSGAQPAASA